MTTPPSGTRYNFIGDEAILDKLCPYCGQKCVIITSKTAANPGRKFYKCPDLGMHKNFFQWCDESTPDKRQHVILSPKPRLVISDRRQDSLQSQYPECSCGAGICNLRISLTERNRARKFFVCPIQKGQGACNFFQWEDGRGNVTPDQRRSEIGNSTPILTSDSPEEREEMYMNMSKCKNINDHSGFIPPEAAEERSQKIPAKEHYFKNELVGLDAEVDDHLFLPIGDLRLDARKTSDTCFRCGKEGHWSKDCTQFSSPCYKCGKSGHWRKDCTA